MDDDEDEYPPLLRLSEVDDEEPPPGYTYGFRPIVEPGLMTYDEYLEIRAWCKERFGREGAGSLLAAAWTEARTGIWFRDHAAATEFKLRWL